ncbi:MAG TPA: HDOD domain-containing protein [Pirellulaceae bacterium]|nr:HDOD domain-containing protein [Pirellulaceae bacterium]
MTTAPPEGLLGPLVANADRLYSLPAVALEVVRLTSQPYLDTRELKTCLEKDPALTARILKVVNSSIFGLPRKVTDLAQALGLLGIKPLKMLVLGFSLPKQLWEGLEAKTVIWYWRHSLVKAMAARELSASFPVNDGDEAFLAALLQDVGILVLVGQLNSPYLSLLAEARGDPEALRELETQSLGFDHVELGANLLESWGLAPALLKAVQFPQERAAVQSLSLPDRSTAQVLHLAHLLASVLDDPAGPAMGQLLEAGEAYCRLTVEEVRQVAAVVQEKVRDLAGIFQLELPGGDSYADLVVAAHRNLSDVSAAAGAVLAWRNRECALLLKTRDLRQELLQAAVAGARGFTPIKEPTHRRTALVSATETLRARAATESAVTERLPLAAHPLLVRRVADAIARCRAARSALTLVLVAVDDFALWLAEAKADDPEQAAAGITRGLTLWTDDRGPVWHLENGHFALLWDGADRDEGGELMRHALKEAQAWTKQPSAELIAGPTFSAGVATLEVPSKNFPPQKLIEGAQRCLDGAILSGGNTVKTIAL